jgi:hypothetical protein
VRLLAFGAEKEEEEAFYSAIFRTPCGLFVRDEITKRAVIRGQSTLQKPRYKCLKKSYFLH